ncbi:adenosylmethionine-8-amino-7-oxononanoate aminotransferase apoenzyme [Austwickia chelonae]|uniref:Adenosylmethionine-8-amino-7-oxononanoate aminotransferase n=1 Tax=Austwickia chelonae NBRC 105200 TaxID=1184607 RepID=K6VR93_9MICO|nr:adenosylmethionine--8-amino-7-oxononanoate transaminase [Austwickia chelonae]GAB79274.1 adenosylmethionine-8-amino-7-oxononanoate aminotransferase [Austwickia chelonae NBRC 105200]SEW37820.1 adenosylmethionine-8-amino-7-oxononanoate aminotransferase apoenzyme [Austwickia chelonae]
MHDRSASVSADPTAVDLVLRDRTRVWHPYASTVDPGPLYVVNAASGTRLTLSDGRTTYDVVDGMSSWWCAIHGYRNPVLDEALAAQAARFSHVMFGGLTHEPAVALAEALVSMAPPGLGRVFLADSGSVAMEVALKLARQLALTRAAGRTSATGPSGHSGSEGAARTKVAALRGGYHGDTLGAMSVCDPDGGMHAAFADSIPAQLFLPRPPSFTTPADDPEMVEWAVRARELIHGHRDVLAAIVVEPILQGAGGMWSWAPAALSVLRELADEYELLLIADEIATGFGRTGRLFACEWAQVVPDVLVVGKALTGGYMTQAAVLARDEIAAEIGRGPFGALMHGPTFMGNPLASAVSLASLGLLADGAWEPLVGRAAHVLSRELAPLAESAGTPGSPVGDVRVLGATAAIELTVPLDMPLALRTAVEHGVWLRPFRNLVYAMPPYVADESDLVTIAHGMRAVVGALAGRAS